MEKEMREYTRKRDSVASLVISAGLLATIPVIGYFFPIPADKKEYRTAFATYQPSSDRQEEPLQITIDKKDLSDLLSKYSGKGSVVCNQDNDLYFSVVSSPFNARLEVGSLRPSKNADYAFISQNIPLFEIDASLLGSKEGDLINGSSVDGSPNKEREGLIRAYHSALLPKIIEASKKEECAPLKQEEDAYTPISLPTTRYVLGSLFPSRLNWRDSPKHSSIPAENMQDPNSKTSLFAQYRFDAGLGEQLTLSFGGKNYVFIDGMRNFSGPFDGKLDLVLDGKKDLRGPRAEFEFGQFFKEVKEGIFSHYQHTLSDKLAMRGFSEDMPQKYRIALKKPSTLRLESSGNEGIALDYSFSHKQITRAQIREDALDILVDSPLGHPFSKAFFSPRLLETDVAFALKENHDISVPNLNLENFLKNQVPAIEEFRARSVVSDNGRFWPKWNVWEWSRGTDIFRN